ncbi:MULTISPECIES: M16 family metallopeptidase [Rhizobium/Agrobacterium group]|jgi:predicted Zn-dependent peptidase|uniref:Insulinase family protein n=2 Tax=Rhizobium/Agrobacterium group TaxID=227290 RepID=A0A1B9UAS0_AGRTU|nr:MULTISPECIES: pitrilysin family protein [Rhizobium/Agrobacterium group]AKC06487.1 peptidase, family M16 [Agrobacterium tumefaciens]EHJ99144.1 M16 family peptidase [Agrobacterium tumefaciens 5A]MDP9559478.1 putative Zn-dependent peptidase [Rhizobium nepotum]QDG92449.1 insulinase family protein [Rhizobium sp. NIBRBAC000502774]HCV71887.1 insulinase family protein [Agrobacterium sp.]
MRVNVTRLSSGLTVVTERMPHLESVALGVWIKSGSRNETTAEHGIAHLLEHMAFKGTARRTARQIAEEIENVGGEVNAATSTETTSYYARVLKDHVPLAVDILADILTESLFDEDELEREKNVILQEIGAATDTPDDVIFDNFSGVAYRDQTIGRPILGTPETVQSFTSAQIRHYLARNYTTDRIFVVAAGAVDHQSFVKQVEERFASLPQLPVTTPVLEKAIYTGGEIRETRDLMDAQVLLGFEGKAYHARDFYCSQILANILGGGMSSRLFQEVRESRGLCYSVYAFHWGFSDTGIFGVHAATGGNDLPELMPVIVDELRKSSQTIHQEEIDRARAQIRAQLLMGQESPAARAGQMARQMMLYGRPIPNEEMMERLNDITRERLTDLAGRLFFDTVPTLSAIGPLEQLPPLSDITAALSAQQPARIKANG